MKRLYSLLIAQFFYVLLCAQQGGGAPAPGKGAYKTPSNGRVYGKVIDAKDKSPVEFASVVLLAARKDSLISGNLVKTNGDFSLDNLPYGQFRLRISFIGYVTYEIPVVINGQKVEQDLGNLKLSPDEHLLKEVEVTAEKSTVVMSVDRKIYNVDKDLSVKGGTAVDVMKNIPSVTVDGDGNAQLRNSAPQIYIDGRPTTLTLNQIPADQIERVEVITNPSVKFDAGTTGGILNIVLKRNSKPGYNGTVMANVGTGDRYGGMANINIKQNPFNLSLTYNYNAQSNNNNGYTNRTNLSNGATTGYYDQDNIAHQTNMFSFGRLALDYYMNNRNTLSLIENAMVGHFNTKDDQNFYIRDANKTDQEYGNRINDQKAGFKNATTQMIFRHTFPKVGKELTADVNWNYSNGSNKYLFTTYNYLGGGSSLPDNPQLQNNDGTSRSNQFVAQVDFVNPINEKSKFEAGFKSYFKRSNNYNTTNNYDYTVYDYVRDSIMSNNYQIDDMINAAYANYSSVLGKWNYQAGLRFEQSHYSGTIIDKKQTFSYSYPSDAASLMKSIFPALYLTRKLQKNQEVQLNFSRKINRPNFFQMMPFVMFADKQNYRIGNPQLRPEFYNLMELNYNKVLPKGNYLGALYGRYEEQPITNVAYPSAADPSVLVNTSVNGKNGWRYGMEHTFRITLWKNFDATANFNLFYVYIRGAVTEGQPDIKTDGWSYTGKLNLTYRFPKQFTLQLNGNYEAPKVILQGTTLNNYFMDASISKALGQHWNFNLVLSDVFNTKHMGTYYDTQYYTQDISRRRETRFLRFSATYTFGKMDASVFKRKSTKKDNGQGMGNGDGLDF